MKECKNRISVEEALDLVAQEYKAANEKFPGFNSPHEGYAVLLEEVEELWEEIKNNKSPMSAMRQKDEAIQVAAMAIKFLTSCCYHNL
jgi:NTP pyrophosphatase (non-canonical NTP hydrolase)